MGKYVQSKTRPAAHSSPRPVQRFAVRRIRGSRGIEYENAHSADFMWLVSGRTIDHSTISDFRREHKKELKDIHRQMLRTAINMGLGKLSELCIDGTRCQV